MCEFAETDNGQLSFLEDPSIDDFPSEIPEDVEGSDNIDEGQLDGQESFIEDDNMETVIGGRRDMSLEEVQNFQKEGWDEVEQMRNESPPDEDTRNAVIEEESRLEDEINGKVEWPDNDGAVEGTEHDRNLEVGEEFTRRTHTGTVNDDGSYAGEKGISFEESSLPGNEEDYDVTNYRVTEDMPDDIYATESEVASAFEQDGGGNQLHFKREHPWNPNAEPIDVPMQDMKDYGYIEETK